MCTTGKILHTQEANKCVITAYAEC